MQGIVEGFGSLVTGLGAAGVMFIVVFLLGLVFRRGFGASLRSGLLVAVALAGLLLLVDKFTAQMTPVITAIVARFNVQKEIMDVGWTTYVIGVGSLIYVASIPINLLVNTAMLALRWTQTINVDIHNMWHGAAVGGFVYAITGSYVIGLVVAVIYMIVIVKLSDLLTPTISGYFNTPGLCWTTASTTENALLAWPILWLLNKIPGMEKIKVDPETIQQKFGFLGEPSVIGFVLGVLFAIAGGYNFTQTVVFAIWVAALLVLTPLIVRPLIQGMTSVTSAVSERLSKAFPKGVWVAVDTAVLVGNPSVVATAILLTPIAVLLSLALPWIRMIPVASLVALPWIAVGIVGIAKGDILKSVITGTIVMAILLSIATYVAPAVTAGMPLGGLEMPAGAQLVSAIDHAGTPLTGITVFITNLVTSLAGGG